MQLDDEDVRAILQLLDASTFDELQIETDRFNLILRREGATWTRETRTPGVAVEFAGVAPSVAAAPAAGAAAAAGAASVAVPVAESVEATEHLVPVRTPLPGTFYRSPRPGAPPFIVEGAVVEPDTVVAIVETMKLMNSVYAGHSGRIAEICCADAAFVPQQAVLMRIEPETP